MKNLKRWEMIIIAVALLYVAAGFFVVGSPVAKCIYSPGQVTNAASCENSLPGIAARALFWPLRLFE